MTMHEELSSLINSPRTAPSTHAGPTPSVYANLARAEFALSTGKKVHREPVKPFIPPLVVGPYDTCHMHSYRMRSPQKIVVPEFTVGEKNALGTNRAYRKVSLDELRLGQISLANPTARNSWGTTYGSSYVLPDRSDRFQGDKSERGGMPPRLPYSEIERRFGSLDSTGTMPGADRGARTGRSEVQEKFPNPGRQPLREPEFTLRFANDIGSGVTASKVPPTMLNATHFDLGTSGAPTYETSSATAHGRMQPSRPTEGAAGGRPPVGVSEVERGFRGPMTSRDYNIVNGGERLGGALNTEAARTARVSCGHKQHPDVDPALRGPTGARQSYDIISGLERPKYRYQNM